MYLRRAGDASIAGRNRLIRINLTSTTVLWIFGWNVSDLGVCCFQGAFWGTRCLVGDSVVGWLTLSIRGLPLVG